MEETKLKIVHICLASSYIDNYMYQENLLPLYHKNLGYEVYVLANCLNYSNGKVQYTKPSEYYNDTIKITRVKLLFGNNIISKKLRIYHSIHKYLLNIKPDLIFCHDAQFWNTNDLKKYLNNHKKTKLFIDCHTDEGNSAKNIFSKLFLHMLYYRWRINKIKKYVNIFWGVLPRRIDFLNKYYGIKKEKCGYLELGFDDLSLFKTSKQNIPYLQNYYVISGRFDFRKNTYEFCVEWLKVSMCKLVLVGPIIDERLKLLISDNRIIHINWLVGKNLTDLIKKSNAMIFPGTHSTLWEWSFGLGVNTFVRKKYSDKYPIVPENLHIIDDESELDFVKQITSFNITRTLVDNPNFKYSNISRKSIQQYDM